MAIHLLTYHTHLTYEKAFTSNSLAAYIDNNHRFFLRQRFSNEGREKEKVLQSSAGR